MKSIVRSLLLCFLMLALPFQAFAAAGMLPPVASGTHAPASLSTHAATRTAPDALPPCHRQAAPQQMAHRQTAHGHAAAPAKAAPAPAAELSCDTHASRSGEHAKGQCGTCGACCVGAAVAAGLPAVPAPSLPSSASIPFRAAHLPSVDPVQLERPPSPLLA